MASKGITVNAVCPGYTDTEMVTGAIDNIRAKTGRSRDEVLAELGRSEEEIARLRKEGILG